MKPQWIAAIGAMLALSAGAQEFDFEQPLVKPGGIGPTFVNPTGNFRHDATGTQARRGKGAVELSGDGRITMDFKPVTPETRYRLSAFLKGSGHGLLQLSWLGAGKTENVIRSCKLTGEYQRLNVLSAAPAWATHVYLIVYPNRDGGKLFVDDLSFEPVPDDGKRVLIDFEEPLTKPGTVGKIFVNPTGSFRYDASGDFAMRGLGAMELRHQGRISMDFKGASAGQAYRLSLFAKGKGALFLQFQWYGKLDKAHLATQRITLTEKYGEYSLTSTAPAGAVGAYVHIFLTGDASACGYIDDVDIVAEKPAAPPLGAEFTGDHNRFSIYRLGEPVKLRVSAGAEITAPDVLTWSLRDYRDQECGRGEMAVTPEQLRQGVELSVTPRLAGSYFWHLKLAKSGATVPWKGSRPASFVAFGVLPQIAALPVSSADASRFGGQGTNFIGSGAFMKGDPFAPFYPAVGMKWVYCNRSLASSPTAPVDYRTRTAPDSAKNQLAEITDLTGIPASLAKLPPYLPASTPLRGTAAQAYPLADPAKYTELVRLAALDRKAYREAFFPHQKRNYFQLHWEPDWHWQGSEEEFIEYYRAAQTGIRNADPDAFLLGANYGVAERGAHKMESMFRKGWGKYLDGILIHLYFLPVSGEPEAAGLHRDCRKIRRMADRWIRPGAPVINTEWGVDYRGTQTRDLSQDLLRNHLSRFTRGHLIALGEGFDATWFFYTTDYCDVTSDGGEQGYGMSFNTSSYIKEHKFGAAAIEPKPTMMAAAAMTRLLEGTKTLGRLDQLPEDIFCYAFRRGNENLLAVWTPGKDRELALEVGADEVTVYDIMGNPRRAAAPQGVLTLPVGRDVQYILGVADAVLPVAARTAGSVFRSARAEVTAGSPVAPLLRDGEAPRLELRRDGRRIPLTGTQLPEALDAGFYALAALDGQGKTAETMMLECVGRCAVGEITEELDGDGQLSIAFQAVNRGSRAEEFTFRGKYDGKVFAETARRIAPGETATLRLPMAKSAYPGLALPVLQIEVATAQGLQGSAERRLGVLTPPPVGKVDVDGVLRDWAPTHFSRWFGREALTYQPKAHRGGNDFSARYALGVRDGELLLAVDVRDDVAQPTRDAAQPWRNDSLILALGGDSDGNGEFRNVRRFSFTVGEKGEIQAQELFGSPPKGRTTLPSGSYRAAIRRDADRLATVYEIALPLSLFPVASGSDKRIGFGLTLHDVDSAEEVAKDLHREMSLAGGVPLFMGNVKFATLLLPPAGRNPASEIWDLPALQARATYEFVKLPESEVPGYRTLLYDGRPGKVFAYYGVPEGTPPAGGFPGLVLVHGGGGTAFTRYMEGFRKQGYAVLAMDLYGKRPLARNDRERLPIPGSEPIVWERESVENIIIANSVLRSMPGVNPDRIGMIGVSWGGVFTSIAATLDTRLRFAIAVYGCGYWAAGQDQADFSRSRRSCWFDPGNFLPFARVPLYWIKGEDDGSFGNDSWRKSVAAAPSTRDSVLLPKLSHSHQGFALPEVSRWAAEAK